MAIFPILESAIVVSGIRKKEIASSLGISQKSLSNKLCGRTAFSLPEAELIQKCFFPDIGISELFQKADDARANGGT